MLRQNMFIGNYWVFFFNDTATTEIYTAGAPRESAMIQK